MRRLVVLAVGLLAGVPSTTCAGPPEADWFPRVEPLAAPTGDVLHVSTVEELFEAARQVTAGGTIVLADGHYRMPRYFEITTDGVTLRSDSGNRHAVVLDGAGSRHGELLGISGCDGVTIADITIQNVKFNGIKINSDRGAQRVTVHNCVLHNIWQRGIKAPGIPDDNQRLRPRDCRIQGCLFYNDRPKQFADDGTDTPETFDGNYIGGIDVKNTTDWVITDNVFLGIQGRTREGRGCVYISENGRGCVIERNVFLNCDIAIALGNPSLEYSEHHAVNCVARNNFIADCPETGILACFTRDCVIEGNTIHDPESPRGRLIWVQNANAGLRVERNLLVGSPVRVTGSSRLQPVGNVVLQSVEGAAAGDRLPAGQTLLPAPRLPDVLSFPTRYRKQQAQLQAALQQSGRLSDDVIAAMRRIHQDFDGQPGYVAQLGDSITYSMAFWKPVGWDDPDRYLSADDGLPRRPESKRWRDWIRGTGSKGPAHGNYSGWTVRQLNQAVDGVLEREQPEVAIIMIGTNDIAGGHVPAAYRQQLDEVVHKCLMAHCIPILNTIPPRRNRDEAVDQANRIIREVAADRNIPLADFHAECIRLRPGHSWDGTLIADDGVHPTGGRSNVYTHENLRSCGYALRNWVNFLVLRRVYFDVLEARPE